LANQQLAHLRNVHAEIVDDIDTARQLQIVGLWTTPRFGDTTRP
jgi:hypothetical protein